MDQDMIAYFDAHFRATAQQISSEISALREETREQISALREEMMQQISSLHEENRQRFEQVVQTHRAELGQAGVRLHVATKDAASGRREQYITVDGVRYSALSRELLIGKSSRQLEAAK